MGLTANHFLTSYVAGRAADDDFLDAADVPAVARRRGAQHRRGGAMAAIAQAKDGDIAYGVDDYHQPHTADVNGPAWPGRPSL